ncbi:MAG: phosphoribosylformylglycinamidine cyclo-ligase [Thermodesulfobacteriota bacterium]
MADRSRAYTEAGVNIQTANTFVDRIKAMIADTYTKGVISEIGGFGGLFKLNTADMQEPVLVASTDGVGTKLKMAFYADKHDTIGIDLVAMSVNDILVQGAKPLFFLDYFATSQLRPEVAEQVVAGVAQGCKQARCALLGGETAEMPDFYAEGEYDLSGFCVGLVDNAQIVDGSSIAVGDKLIGLASSGLHSNGYSLVRKLISETGLDLDAPLPGTKQPAREVFLEPTKIYARTVRTLLRDLPIKGMVHVTGGGFYDNVGRVLPRGVRAHLDFGSWEVPPVFHWLKRAGGLEWPEMLSIFNCGIGMVLVVPRAAADDFLSRLGGLGEPAWIIGDVRAQRGEAPLVEITVPETDPAC